MMISFTTVGMIYAIKLYKREELLESMQKAVCEIKDIIRYFGTEYEEIIEHIEGKYEDLFQNDLFDADRKIFKRFLSELGKTDTLGQQNFCDGILKDIDRNLVEARRNKNEKAKLYATLGICAGLAVSIIIF